MCNIVLKKKKPTKNPPTIVAQPREENGQQETLEPDLKIRYAH